MSDIVRGLILDSGWARHCAHVATANGQTGFACALNQEADRLAAQAKKAAGK